MRQTVSMPSSGWMKSSRLEFSRQIAVLLEGMVLELRVDDHARAVDGSEREMVFLTNKLEWSSSSVADLYGCRWSIEVFFKQIKQTLQLADFLGHSANAVRWQVWTALLVYVLLRFLAFIHDWSHSFTRLFTLVRCALWRRWDLFSLLRSYGTASGHFRFIATPQQSQFQGL